MNSFGKYLNCQEETIFHTTDKDVNEFILHHFGKAFDFVKYGYDDFPIECYVHKGAEKSDEVMAERFQKEETVTDCNIVSLLTVLCQDGWLEPGNYLIRKDESK